MTGTTIAELGNRNRPLDMIAYEKADGRYLLIANNSRGVMKLSTDGIAEVDSILTKIDGGGTAGVPYETIDELEGVVQLDKLDGENALVLVQLESGELRLQSIPLP